MTWRTKLILFALACFLLGAGFFLFTGPRMKSQPHLRTFQATMPELPEGTVPVADAIEPVPTTRQARELANPLPQTAETLARGKVYYGYYCAFCHGRDGPGDGPVGHSFFPDPADLRSDRVQRMTDGQLLRAMLTGVGHERTLYRVVPGDCRWYLVAYVRSLGADRP